MPTYYDPDGSPHSNAPSGMMRPGPRELGTAVAAVVDDPTTDAAGPGTVAGSELDASAMQALPGGGLAGPPAPEADGAPAANAAAGHDLIALDVGVVAADQVPWDDAVGPVLAGAPLLPVQHQVAAPRRAEALNAAADQGLGRS